VAASVACANASTHPLHRLVPPGPAPITYLHAGRDPCPSASAWYLPTNDQTASRPVCRPHLLDLALPALVRLARFTRLRATGDRDRLAWQEVPRTLGEPDAFGETRSTGRCERGARSDPQDVLSQSALGRASYRRGAGQDRDPPDEINRGEVYGSPAQTSVHYLAGLS